MTRCSRSSSRPDRRPGDVAAPRRSRAAIRPPTYSYAGHRRDSVTERHSAMRRPDPRPTAWHTRDRTLALTAPTPASHLHRSVDRGSRTIEPCFSSGSQLDGRVDHRSISTTPDDVSRHRDWAADDPWSRHDVAGRHRLHDVTTGAAALSRSPTTRATVRQRPITSASRRRRLPRRATVAVSRAPARRLSITLRHKAIFYDTDAVVRIHLGHAYNGRVVTLLDARTGKRRDGYSTATSQSIRKPDVARVHDACATRRSSPTSPATTALRACARRRCRRLRPPTPFLRLDGCLRDVGQVPCCTTRTDAITSDRHRSLPSQAGRCVRFDDETADRRQVESMDGASPCVSTDRAPRRRSTYFHTTARRSSACRIAFQAFYHGDAVHTGRHGRKYVKFTARGRTCGVRAECGDGSWTMAG